MSHAAEIQVEPMKVKVIDRCKCSTRVEDTAEVGTSGHLAAPQASSQQFLGHHLRSESSACKWNYYVANSKR
eukprot:CAMPEP_0179150960 /NCGR_PEP_ID=MMETSP0796-20121207/73253_1 /TAXON_ID=73915 /ORGANISM="Pyrodinium bahamense, Strain pbaha01" /LENGTH=71 /DNA_ID=CAMNT_0020851995 /DNA_START=441 /DNA_END=656 /DNA_ORIENTATION=+